MIKLKKILTEEGNYISWHTKPRDSHVDPPTDPKDELGINTPPIDFADVKVPHTFGDYQIIEDYYLSTMDIQELKKVIKEHRDLDFYANYKAYMVICKDKKFIVASIPEEVNYQDSTGHTGMGEYFIKDELGWRIPENDEYASIGRDLGKML